MLKVGKGNSQKLLSWFVPFLVGIGAAAERGGRADRCFLSGELWDPRLSHLNVWAVSRGLGGQSWSKPGRLGVQAWGKRLTEQEGHGIMALVSKSKVKWLLPVVF